MNFSRIKESVAARKQCPEDIYYMYVVEKKNWITGTSKIVWRCPFCQCEYPFSFSYIQKCEINIAIKDYL